MGTRNIGMIEKTRSTTEPVLLDFGTQKFRISNPEDKKWFLQAWAGYRKTGQEIRFLEKMGTLQGFESLLDQFAEYHAKLDQQAAAGGQGRQKYGQKYAQKPTQYDLVEDDGDNMSPRIARLTTQLRSRYPDARNNDEAMMFAVADTQRKSQEEINKLEKQADELEKDVKQDIENRISSLGQTKGRSGPALQQIKATTDKQQQIINKIIQIDQSQQQALDDLGATVSTTPNVVSTAPVSAATVAPAPAPAPVPQPSAQPSVEPNAFGQMANQLATKPVSPPPADVEPIDISTISRPRTTGADNVVPISSKRKKSKQLKLPLDAPAPSGERIQKVAEGLGNNSLAVLQQAKQNIEQQRAAEIDAWRQDFEKNTVQRAGQQLKQKFAPAPVAAPGEGYGALKTKLVSLNQAIQKQQYLDMLSAQAEKMGLLNEPGLRADIDTSMYARDGARDSYITLNKRLDTAVERVKARIAQRKAAYAKPKGVAEAENTAKVFHPQYVDVYFLDGPRRTPMLVNRKVPYNLIDRYLEVAIKKYNLQQSRFEFRNAEEENVAEGFNGEYDDEAGMANTNLHTIARAAEGLLNTIDDHENLPEWVQEKIAKVEGMMVTAWDYLKSQEEQGIDPRQELDELSPQTLASYVRKSNTDARNRLQQDPKKQFNKAQKRTAGIGQAIGKIRATMEPATKQQGVAENEKIAGRHDPEEFDAIVDRLKKLAAEGPRKTVWDPVKRVYKTVPVSQQPVKK
jgi:hypothetical protein